MANADISLLFGVLGEGSLGGESGSLIQSQLTQIMAALNKNPLKVKVALDTASGGQKSWSSQLQSKLNTISSSGKFSVQVSKLTLGTGAISDFRNQLNAVVNTLHLDKGTSITLTAEGIGEIKSKVKQAGDAASDAARKTAEFKVQMEALNRQKVSVQRALSSLSTNATTDEERAKIAELTTQYEQWAIKIEQIRATKTAATGSYRAEIEAEGAAITANIAKLNEERVAAESASASAAAAAGERVTAEEAAASATERGAAVTKSAAAEQKDLDVARRQGLSLLTQMQKAEMDWTAAKTGSSSGEYDRIQSSISSLQFYLGQLEKREIDVITFRQHLADLNSTFAASSNAIKLAGENTRTFSERMGALAEKFSSWLSVSQVIMLGIRSIKKMVSATIELDDAMTQLKIVTRDTSTAYEAYLNNISKIATKISSSIPDLIDSTTTFARLGYSLEESTSLAEFTAMLQNVGDIDVSDAQDAITAIIKAFGVSVDEIESIMDKLVVTGNNFPISVDQIAEGMNNASSALAAAGNTFEQSVALLTAANTTIQNASKSSTGLRTIAARLRSTTTELEDLGESMTEEQYGDLVSALTKYNVALTDINGEFRSTYDIVADIAAIWNELSTMEQAALANAIAGVRQQSVFFSMVEQFQEASGAMDDMANSAGTLEESYATYMESTTAHMNQFRAAFQALGQTVVDTSFLNFFIDIGTKLLDILGAIVKITNAIGGLKTILSAMFGIMIATQTKSIVAFLVKSKNNIKSLADNISAVCDLFRTARSEGANFGTTLIDIFGLLTSGASALNIAIGAIGIALAVIPTIYSVYQNIHKSNKDLIRDAEDLKTSYNTAISEINQNIQTLNGLQDEFNKLSHGVDDYGNNVSLAADDYERYRDIIDTIVGITPELISGYDNEGRAIANKNALLEESIRLMEEQHRQSLIEFTSAENIVTAGNGAIASIKELGNRPSIQDFASQFASAVYRYVSDKPTENYYGQIYDLFVPDRDIDLYGDAADLFAEDYYSTIVNALRNNYSILEDYFTNEEIKNLLRTANDYDQTVDVFNRQVDRYAQELNPTLQLLPQTLTSYNELSNTQKQFLSEYINTFRVTADTTKEDLEQMRYAILDFTDFLLGNSQLDNIFSIGFSLRMGQSASGEDLTVKEYQDYIQSFIDQVNQIEDPEISIKLKTVFGIDGNGDIPESDISAAIEHVKGLLQDEYDDLANDLSISDVLQIYYNISANPNSMTFDELMSKVGSLQRLQLPEIDFSDLTDNLTSALEKLDEFHELLNNLNELEINGGELDLDSYIKLAELLPEVAGNIHSVEEAQRAVGDAIISAEETARIAYGAMSVANQAWVENTINSTASLANALATYYGNDVSNWAKTADSKWNVDKELIKSLSAMWSEYMGYTTAELQQLYNVYADLETGWLPGGMTAKQEEEFRKIGVILELRKQLEEGFNSLSNTSYNYSASSNSGSRSTTQRETDEIEEYIVEIDKYREAIERLNRIRIDKDRTQLRLDNTADLREQISIQNELVGIYKQEQDALHSLNNLRDDTILEGVERLRSMDFDVEYDPDTNKFFIQNLEHINDLVAESAGEYDSIQEATNAFRKDTEELIETLTDLNEENQEGSDAWLYLQAVIRTSKIAIIDALKDITVQASDAVDEIQNVYDTLKNAADEYAENGGFISVDAFQKIVELGPQYMQYLRDENGLLIINEENINKVIAARTRQLAAEQAVTYVDRLRLALQEDSIENLDTLLYATTEASDATFGLAYAQLAMMHSIGDLDDEQYAAALHNIRSIEALANTAISGIGKTAGGASKELEEMGAGVDDILKYVMDMLKHHIQQQIDSLEDLKDTYGDMIDLRKNSLDAAKEEAEYEDKVAEKVKQIAKLQERINALSLDNSRDAQAQKLKLEEEMAQLQKELADEQSSYAVEAQKDALDDMQESYEKEKDAEIAALEETISSYQKLYDIAIDYIENNWDTLYDELIAWNTEYGSVLNSEITTAWDNCLAAAQRYGSYVAALSNIGNDTAASAESSSASNNTVVGTEGAKGKGSREYGIHAIIREMYRNSQEYLTASKERQAWLGNRNLKLGAMLPQYGVNAHRESDGAWYIDGSKELLYDKYRKYIYHKGGIAGDKPTLKQNEVMAILEKGEPVLDREKEGGLYRIIDFVTALSEKFGKAMASMDMSRLFNNMHSIEDKVSGALDHVSDGKAASIQFGDVYIYGGSEETAAKHQEINRQFTNEVLRQLNIRQ